MSVQEYTVHCFHTLKPLYMVICTPGVYKLHAILIDSMAKRIMILIPFMKKKWECAIDSGLLTMIMVSWHLNLDKWEEKKRSMYTYIGSSSSNSISITGWGWRRQEKAACNTRGKMKSPDFTPPLTCESYH